MFKPSSVSTPFFPFQLRYKHVNVTNATVGEVEPIAEYELLGVLGILFLTTMDVPRSRGSVSVHPFLGLRSRGTHTHLTNRCYAFSNTLRCLGIFFLLFVINYYRPQVFRNANPKLKDSRIIKKLFHIFIATARCGLKIVINSRAQICIQKRLINQI
jgi:hypothetical protein